MKLDKIIVVIFIKTILNEIKRKIEQWKNTKTLNRKEEKINKTYVIADTHVMTLLVML